MSGPVFVDSNVLVYQRDASEEEKQEQADVWVRKLWETRLGRISYQVLHEYYVNVTAKLKPGLSAEEAQSDIRNLLAWKPLSLEWPILEGAFALEQRWELSFWDALIVSAAQNADCGYLLSEDLQAGQDFDGVLVVNPFARSPAEVLSK
jgi:predicted nucleic acid-binding protein